MAGELDQSLLVVLYRYGPASAGTVIELAAPQVGHYGYKRLFWLKRHGLVNVVTYSIPAGKRRRLKRAAIYYLTAPGMRFVLNTQGRESNAENARPKPESLEAIYRRSRFLYVLHREMPDLDIETARDVRDRYELPNNVLIDLVIDGDIAVYTPRGDGVKKRQIRWLVNCIDKIAKRGVARHHIIVARDREHRRKLAAAMMGRPPILTHILLADQADLAMEVKQIPSGLKFGLEDVWDRVDVRKSPVRSGGAPTFTVHTPVTSFHAVDLTTFDLQQVGSVTAFSASQAQKDGLIPTLLIAVQTEDDMYDLARLYAPELVEYLCFAILDRPVDYRFNRFVHGKLTVIQPRRSRS